MVPPACPPVLLQGYGLTETCAASFVSAPDVPVRGCWAPGGSLGGVTARLHSPGRCPPGSGARPAPAVRCFTWASRCSQPGAPTRRPAIVGSPAPTSRGPSTLPALHSAIPRPCPHRATCIQWGRRSPRLRCASRRCPTWTTTRWVRFHLNQESHFLNQQTNPVLSWCRTWAMARWVRGQLIALLVCAASLGWVQLPLIPTWGGCRRSPSAHAARRRATPPRRCYRLSSTC